MSRTDSKVAAGFGQGCVDFDLDIRPYFTTSCQLPINGALCGKDHPQVNQSLAPP